MKEKANAQRWPIYTEPETSQHMTDMPIAGYAIHVGECLGSVTEAAQGARIGRGSRIRIQPGSFDPA
ncbi:hypothetical protein [Bosea sp. (in: a-proteobacteria)]|jgi:hypothetical protein|uniref:hypothetical protein n=1 Tax=Bosea sp. (in: a-proteobacteria) TaxID=1871050 RepID=UPI002DDD7F71|nr:hypothetical protein [Bosea sp. (in: a-proteobacteria)]HEV2511750.1 hypothetical protein [Bosea sp. (in: a-proteobacteria)]